MVAVPPIETSPDPRYVDQRVTLHGVSWDGYELFLSMRGEDAGIRVTYLEGELELMTPSRYHESLKTRLARLVEAYADEAEIDLEGCGSWTVKVRAQKRGAEPDECYVLDGRETDAPDIAIEVVWTSGGLSKLDVYRGLGVPEVWFWQDGALSFHALREQRYIQIPRSKVLPGLDPELLASIMSSSSTQSEAVRLFRKALRNPDDSSAIQ